MMWHMHVVYICISEEYLEYKVQKWFDYHIGSGIISGNWWCGDSVICDIVDDDIGVNDNDDIGDNIGDDDISDDDIIW